MPIIWNLLLLFLNIMSHWKFLKLLVPPVIYKQYFDIADDLLIVFA